MRSRVLLGALFGAIGGFLGYLLQETLLPHVADPDFVPSLRDTVLLGAMVGCMLGLAIGAVGGSACTC